MLTDMQNILTYEECNDLLNKIDEAELGGLLLEYINKNFDINESKNIQSNIDDRFNLDDEKGNPKILKL